MILGEMTSFSISLIREKKVEKQFYYENDDGKNHHLKKKFQFQRFNILLNQTTIPSKVHYAMKTFIWTFRFTFYVMEFYDMSDAELFKN